jgi:esterase/lipase
MADTLIILLPSLFTDQSIFEKQVHDIPNVRIIDLNAINFEDDDDPTYYAIKIVEEILQDRSIYDYNGIYVGGFCWGGMLSLMVANILKLQPKLNILGIILVSSTVNLLDTITWHSQCMRYLILSIPRYILKWLVGKYLNAIQLNSLDKKFDFVNSKVDSMYAELYFKLNISFIKKLPPIFQLHGDQDTLICSKRYVVNQLLVDIDV